MMPTVHGVKLNAGSTPANNVLNATVYSALKVAGNNAVGCTSAGVMLEGRTVDAVASSNVRLEAPAINTYSADTTMTATGVLTMKVKGTNTNEVRLESGTASITAQTVVISGLTQKPMVRASAASVGWRRFCLMG